MKYAVALCAVLWAGTGMALDFPILKAGLWEQSLLSDGRTAPSSQLCIDANMAKDMMQMGLAMSRQMCTRSDVKFSGNKAYGEAECSFGGSKMISKSVTTFNSDSSYRSEAQVKYDPPFMGKSGTTTVVEAKWKGACPADMQPGDIIVPGGMKMNLRNMPGMKQ